MDNNSSEWIKDSTEFNESLRKDYPFYKDIRIATESKYYGIKGWLLFFSLFFLIFPLFMFIFSDKSTDGFLELTIKSFNTFLLMLSGATILTKNFLAIRLIYYYFIWRFFDLIFLSWITKPDNTYNDYIMSIVKNGILIITIYFYFSLSKRVKATFGQYFPINKIDINPAKVTEEEYNLLNKDTVELEGGLDQINAFRADLNLLNGNIPKNTTGNIVKSPLEQKLIDLKSLKEKNLISDEEYSEKKKEILSKY